MFEAQRLMDPAQSTPLQIEIPGAVLSGLESIAQAEDLHLNSILAGTWALLVSRITGREAVTTLDGSVLTVKTDLNIQDWLKTMPASTGAVVFDSSRSLVLVPVEPDLCAFQPDGSKRVAAYFKTLLERIPQNLDKTVSSLNFVSDDETQCVLYEWNRTEMSYPTTDCIHDQFQRQADATPDAVALAYKESVLTYRELDAAANRLACYLVGLGAGPGALIAVGMERSPELVISLLATLKAGAAYVPLDPTYPAQRLELVLEDAKPNIVLTQRELAERFPAGHRLVFVDAKSNAVHDPKPLSSSCTSADLAYVIYTSGSTGKPKGVMIEHRNVVSFFAAMDRLLGRRQSPGVWLAVTSVAFDISVLELFWTLTRGYKVVLQGNDGLTGSLGEYSITRQIQRHRVTHLQCTPSLARLLASDQAAFASLSVLEALLLGGEALQPVLLERVRTVFSGPIFNMYGPTETTIWSTAGIVDAGIPVNIGRPIANTQTYILDSLQRPVPVGSVGELFIGGAGVARGYLNRPDFTAERFFLNPFTQTGRMYKTGDLARYLPDGKIEYLGRQDFQVKIRGFRIELGEIETLLERHSGVRQAVVIANEDKSGDKRLLAYVVFDDADVRTGTELRNYLNKSLPEHMVPSSFIELPEMPLTDNGKIDRKALPFAGGKELPLDVSYEAPREELEQKIADAWQEALNVERVGINDNLFDLGAHSLLVAEVNSRLREVLDREIPLVAMFQYPTIRALAAHLSGAAAGTFTPSKGVDRARARRDALQLREILRPATRI